jgi:hypothetical protein
MRRTCIFPDGSRVLSAMLDHSIRFDGAHGVVLRAQQERGRGWSIAAGETSSAQDPTGGAKHAAGPFSGHSAVASWRISQGDDLNCLRTEESCTGD